MTLFFFFSPKTSRNIKYFTSILYKTRSLIASKFANLQRFASCTCPKKTLYVLCICLLYTCTRTFSYTSRNILGCVLFSGGIRVPIIVIIVYTVLLSPTRGPMQGEIILPIRVRYERAFWKRMIFTKRPPHSKQPEDPDKVLKYLAHPNTGCNRKVLLPLYSCLIRSILDYWSPVNVSVSLSLLTTSYLTLSRTLPPP